MSGNPKLLNIAYGPIIFLKIQRFRNTELGPEIIPYLAIGHSITQVSRHYVDGNRLQDGMLNRVQAVLRAYDPCLSCSTHAVGQYAVDIRLIGVDGSELDAVRN